jgi:hypothetical protein
MILTWRHYTKFQPPQPCNCWRPKKAFLLSSQTHHLITNDKGKEVRSTASAVEFSAVYQWGRPPLNRPVTEGWRELSLGASTNAEQKVPLGCPV